MNGKVAILIGSETDMETMEASRIYFEYFNIEMELMVMSAHRNPDQVAKFASSARDNGYDVLIGAAGMAAHLAGAIKAHSTLPVIGVPLAGGIQDGTDALFATVQMPKGVPVATMSVGKSGMINAAILCAEIFALNNSETINKLKEFKSKGAKL